MGSLASGRPLSAPQGGVLDPRQASQLIREAKSGKLNCDGSVTLTASATTTAVTDANVGVNTVILLMPTTANAASALATTYVSARGDQTFTLTHTNNSQNDRTFGYIAIG